MNKLTGRFSETFTGLKTYEIYEASASILPVIAALLRDNFGFTVQSLIDGIDVFYLDCVRPDCHLTIGWDGWSGCFIMPLGPAPDWGKLLAEIGAFLDARLDSLGDYFDTSLPLREPGN